jgi:outer membrane lipoprotein-sorting protein
MKNKKIILIAFAIIILIIISIFLICHYKNTKNGNTIINKSEEEILNSILEMKSYNATLSITIETNKNKTQYKVKQTLENGKATQEVLEPENIAGVTTEYDGTNLKITNNKLNLETTFQNYQYIVENRLWLDSFIEEFNKNENTQITSEENEIILEVKNKDNPYNIYKKLYIDKKTGKPTKMIVQDVNKKTLVYILYTEIEIS